MSAIQNLSKNKILLFSIFLMSGLNALEYPYRSIENPPCKLESDAKIFLISPTRTGSTLVYNILQYLFEDRSCVIEDQNKRVQKSHTLLRMFQNEKMEDCYYFCTFRNPISQARSQVRISPEHGPFVLRIIHNVLTRGYYEVLLRLFPHVVFLSYERFENDFSYVFEKIESEFSIQISKEEKDKVRTYFSKEAMKKLADSLGTFDKSDQATRIRGSHIGSI